MGGRGQGGAPGPRDQPGVSLRAIAMGEPGYPPALGHVADPPGRLWLLGARTGWGERSVAIAVVGSRDATAYGLAMAGRLGRELARSGITVVSGLARGIDRAAHEGALAAGGDTVAVLGCGVDVPYPRATLATRQRILERGCLLSELPPGTPPRREHFPRRNRLISGLSLGVVVVEAAARSGSLVTARHALEQGREVFAVPGPALAPRSRGPHQLLKQGAKLVETVEDVLEEFPEIAARLSCAPGRSAAPSSPLLRELARQPDTADGLALRLGRQVAEIARELTDLELGGAVIRGPGGRFLAAVGAGTCAGTPASGRVDSPGPTG